MGAKVLNSDNDELKQRVLSGETSISAGYKELIQRLAVMDKFKKKIQEQAKEKMSLGGGDKKSLLQNSSKAVDPENKIDVRAKLAKTAGVSTDTYSKGKKILDSDNELAKMAGVGTGTVARYDTVMNSDDEELKKKVLANEVSINAGYEKLVQSKIYKENLRMEHSKEKHKNMRFFNNMTVVEKAAYKRQQKNFIRTAALGRNKSGINEEKE